jgi:hypothetical protein
VNEKVLSTSNTNIKFVILWIYATDVTERKTEEHMKSAELRVREIKRNILENRVRYYEGQIDHLYGELKEYSDESRHFAG